MKKQIILGASAAVLGLMAHTLAASSALAAAVITVNVVQDFRTIDPAKISDYLDYMAVVNLYDGLVSVDAGGNIIPELAESWEVSDDATEVTFKLRDDATFTDGSPVEASDVVYSVHRLLRINQGPSTQFVGVLDADSITAVDAKTVKFKLLKTFSPFLATVPAIFVINEEVAKANEGTDDAQDYLGNNVAGAGAYSIKSWERSSRMIVTRNANYYKGFLENPIDEVRWVITNDESTVLALAAAGELTMTSTFQSPETYRALEGMGRFAIQRTATASGFYLKLNSKVAPTDDIHIRRALALATDYETVQEVIFPGAPLTGPLPTAFAAFYADDIPAPKYDLDAAKAEVELSKYAGAPIPITLAYGSSSYQEEISLLLQANLEQIGFQVTLQSDPWTRTTELAANVETTPAVNQVIFGPTYASPDSMFHRQYHSSSSGTWTSMEWLQNPEIDAMIDAARATGDIAEQATIYKELQHKLVDLQSDVFLLTLQSTLAIDKCLTGYTFVPMQSFGYDFTRYQWLCD